MSGKIRVWLLATVLLTSAFSVQAQQPTKVPRVGIVTAQPLSAVAVRHEAFRQGLRELGYLEGKNIVIEQLSTEGKFDRLPALMAEIVRLKVDIIVSFGSTTTRAAQKATSTIPIVMAQDTDPIGNGFVASLARPGGNITGLSSLAADLSGKRLEMLKEIVPKLSHAAVFGTSTNPGNHNRSKRLSSPQTHSGLSFSTGTYLNPKILRPHSDPQAMGGLTGSLCCAVLC